MFSQMADVLPSDPSLAQTHRFVLETLDTEQPIQTCLYSTWELVEPQATP